MAQHPDVALGVGAVAVHVVDAQLDALQPASLRLVGLVAETAIATAVLADRYPIPGR